MTKTDKEVRADREISYVAEVIEWEPDGLGTTILFQGFTNQLEATIALDPYVDDPEINWLRTTASIKEYIGNIFIRKTHSLGLGPQG